MTLQRQISLFGEERLTYSQVGSHVNLTALQESEKKYRTLLANIEDGYWELDLAGNFTFFNHTVCKYLGYPENESVTTPVGRGMRKAP